jgi:hypothetical protein
MLFQRGIFAKALLLQQRGKYICACSEPKRIQENFLPIKPARYCTVLFTTEPLWVGVGVGVSGVLLKALD